MWFVRRAAASVVRLVWRWAVEWPCSLEPGGWQWGEFRRVGALGERASLRGKWRGWVIHGCDVLWK